uniref:BTB domain-containing protein n=1 Tax=Panagrellus redivivus TaxID=6233 RepID=A0A7E4VDB8_PANRE
MLSHDTVEAKTNTVTIKDFDIETVKNTMDFCYGKVEEKSVFEVIGMLKFADKYDIKVVIDRFSDHVDDSIIKNFCAVAQYAWDLGKVDLKTKCIEYYKENHGEITITKEFAELPVDVRDTILKEALALVKDDDDYTDSD